jgi:plasmid stabilization system protein ParE
MERALDWYAVEAPEQVERFERELDRAVGRIVAHPLLAGNPGGECSADAP